MNKNADQGLSLVEMMVVIGVIGILAAVAIPSMLDLINKRRVEMAAAQLSTDIAYARSQTALRGNRIELRFRNDAQNSCYTVSIYRPVGPFCDCLNAAPCPGGGGRTALRTQALRKQAGVSLQPAVGSDYLNFYPPMSVVQPDVPVIAVAGSRGYRLEVRINGIGRAQVCDPDGSMGGSSKRCVAP